LNASTIELTKGQADTQALAGKHLTFLLGEESYGIGLAEGEAAEHACIVVVQVELAKGRPTLKGLIVDGVEEVAQIAAQDIEETPEFGATWMWHASWAWRRSRAS